jgi:hypothetical protein
MSLRGNARGLSRTIAEARKVVENAELEEQANIERTYSNHRASLAEPSRPVTPAGSDGYDQRMPNDMTAVRRVRNLNPIQHKATEKPTGINGSASFASAEPLSDNKLALNKDAQSIKMSLHDIKDILNSVELDPSIQSLNALVPNLKSTVETLTRMLKTDAHLNSKLIIYKS